MAGHWMRGAGFALGLALATAQAATAQTPPAAPPSAEAEALGLRLAKAGALAAMLPALGAKDVHEIIAAHPEYSAADQATLRATAHEVGEASAAKLLATLGHAYAERLDLADLRALVAFEEGPIARRWRKAEPAVIGATMQRMGGLDFKRDVMRAFCTKTGKGC